MRAHHFLPISVIAVGLSTAAIMQTNLPQPDELGGSVCFDKTLVPTSEAPLAVHLDYQGKCNFTWLPEYAAWSQFPGMPVVCRVQFNDVPPQVRHFMSVCTAAERDGAAVMYY